MGSNRPQLIEIEDDGRIVRFRPRSGMFRGRHRWKALANESEPDDSPVADLAKFEASESADDYRHRMMMNAIAFIFTTSLILVGVWLANLMVHA
jgi:hypothetical protein